MTFYRLALPTDNAACARILHEGFARQTEIIFGRKFPFEAARDALECFRVAEPDGYIVAEDEGRVAGLVLLAVPRPAGMLPARSWFPCVRLCIRCLCGRYRGLAFITAARTLLRFALFSRRSRRCARTDGAGKVVIVAVGSAFRGRGIGRALLREGMRRLVRCGMKTIDLEVREDNQPALALYESEGFKVLGRVKTLFGYSLVMSRPLLSVIPADGKRESISP